MKIISLMKLWTRGLIIGIVLFVIFESIMGSAYGVSIISTFELILIPLSLLFGILFSYILDKDTSIVFYKRLWKISLIILIFLFVWIFTSSGEARSNPLLAFDPGWLDIFVIPIYGSILITIISLVVIKIKSEK